MNEKLRDFCQALVVGILFALALFLFLEIGQANRRANLKQETVLIDAQVCEKIEGKEVCRDA